MNLQLEELMAGVEVDRELVVRDYAPTGRKQRAVEEILADLDQLSPEDMLDLTALARVIGFAAGVDAMEAPVSPRGYRLLAKVPRLPRLVVDRLVEHFASLQKLLAANVDDLQAVEGVGETRAKTVREGLSRLAESSILERYV
jgi:diadenylate cyclase